MLVVVSVVVVIEELQQRSLRFGNKVIRQKILVPLKSIFIPLSAIRVCIFDCKTNVT